MADINRIMRSGVFKKSAAVHIEFSSAGNEALFTKFMAAHSKIEEAPAYVASYLWNETPFRHENQAAGALHPGE